MPPHSNVGCPAGGDARPVRYSKHQSPFWALWEGCLTCACCLVLFWFSLGQTPYFLLYMLVWHLQVYPGSKKPHKYIYHLMWLPLESKSKALRWGFKRSPPEPTAFADCGRRLPWRGLQKDFMQMAAPNQTRLATTVLGRHHHQDLHLCCIFKTFYCITQRGKKKPVTQCQLFTKESTKMFLYLWW